jgi:hypothetical protein
MDNVQKHNRCAWSTVHPENFAVMITAVMLPHHTQFCHDLMLFMYTKLQFQLGIIMVGVN